MTNTINELIRRKSIRAYAKKEISAKNKELILEAMVNAPSAGNMQLYTILEISNKKLKDKVADLCDHQEFIKDSKWVLVFLADYHKWQQAFDLHHLKARKIKENDLLLAMEDAIIAAQNGAVAAESLGIGSCYIGDIMENAEEVIKLLKLPKHVYPCCMLVFGYPSAKVKNQIKPKRVDNKFILYQNTYPKWTKKKIDEMFKVKNKNVESWLQAFMERKHNSDFSKEMARSAKVHIKNFID